MVDFVVETVIGIFITLIASIPKGHDVNVHSVHKWIIVGDL